ncbi:MAG TPA: hypothetical protein VGO93_28375 [Candidatus Xenobia bacterium]
MLIMLGLLPLLFTLLHRAPPVVRFRWWLRQQHTPKRKHQYRLLITLGIVCMLYAQQVPPVAVALGVVTAVGLSLLLTDVPIVLGVALTGVIEVANDAVRLGLAIVLAYLAAWALLRWYLVPAGRVRDSYFVGYLVYNWGYRMQSVVAGLQAWRVSARQSSELEFLQQKLVENKQIDDVDILVAGLLHSARGHQAVARRWVRSYLGLKPVFTWRSTRLLAVLWTCGDAASRGDWKEVLWASRAVPSSASARLYREVAQCLLDRERPKPWYLGLLAELAYPGLRPLVGLLAPRPRPDDVLAEPPGVEAGTLPAALAAHVSVLNRPATADQFTALGEAWDHAVRDLNHWMAEAGEAEREELIAEWRAMVVGELARALRESPVSIMDLGRCSGLLAQARRKVRQEIVLELEERSEAISRRKDEKRELAAIEEWDEWTQGRLAYEAAVKKLGRDVMAGIWHPWHTRWCNYGVWLFNERKERLVAHHIFSWLLVEAREMKDDKAVKLETKNSRVSQR